MELADSSVFRTAASRLRSDIPRSCCSDGHSPIEGLSDLKRGSCAEALVHKWRAFLIPAQMVVSGKLGVVVQLVSIEMRTAPRSTPRSLAKRAR